jgi:hypothetical protein
MNTRTRIIGATPIATSNPFGTAKLRQTERQGSDLFAALFARVRAIAGRVRVASSSRR